MAAPWVVRRLRAEGLERTLAHIAQLSPWKARAMHRVAGHLKPEDAQVAVAWAFKVAPHLDGACLEQALTQYVLQRDASVQFVVGVKRDAAFGAHAWVEGDETPSDARDFAPILVRGGP